ncbi:hypothetical protein QJS10_CPB04g01879 [Acorus calamus]|uniref:Uncharacterized protein n=1 Tax=Acorus calamus TaxID=4465 RepID=A0AAV9F2C4_ACOCL|nr:hypothetical protein QJS10_CPB04g01879 [Acorus calamus]
MEVEGVEEVLKVVDTCLARIKWRLRPSSKRRLETDILALCTRLRPVIMVDYGGKMPELQEHLCKLLDLAQKETSTLQALRIMVIEDMIYLIHAREFAEYVLSTLSSEIQMRFVDLEQDPPKLLLQEEQHSVLADLVSIQKLFSTIFHVEQTNKNFASDVPLPSVLPETKSSQYVPCSSHDGEPIASQSSECIDLSSCMQGSQVTIPTLNGWLLGYPIVYLFSKEQIADAICSLSTKSLHLFQIVVCRDQKSNKKAIQEELMSFSVPYDLSMGGENELWAETFLARMLAKVDKCKHVWKNLRLEVSQCYPQSIAL